MKNLQDYMNDKQTELFNETGTFFAFSKEQFLKARKQGVKYKHLGVGMICPKENAKTLLDGLDKIYRDSIKQDIEENGKEEIIIRELHNHECFYTFDTERVVKGLADYGIAEDEILKLFRHERSKGA